MRDLFASRSIKSMARDSEYKFLKWLAEMDRVDTADPYYVERIVVRQLMDLIQSGCSRTELEEQLELVRPRIALGYDRIYRILDGMFFARSTGGVFL
jgi:hypothetical protein